MNGWPGAANLRLTRERTHEQFGSSNTTTSDNWRTGFFGRRRGGANTSPQDTPNVLFAARRARPVPRFGLSSALLTERTIPPRGGSSIRSRRFAQLERAHRQVKTPAIADRG